METRNDVATAAPDAHGGWLDIRLEIASVPIRNQGETTCDAPARP